KADEVALAEGPQDFPGAPDLARHLIRSLLTQDFDPGCSNQLRPNVGLGHAFAFMYRYIIPEGTVPMVPVAVNTFYPPNRPTPRRCYALGQALRRAIESWDSDKRVGVVASGGLSHTIIQEDFDQALLEALLHKDRERLCSFPEDTAAPGSSEYRNWVAL